MAVWDFAP
jgi:putative transposase